MTPRILVTAGGTTEKIDDVRVITNISTGRFGAAIADALVCLGAQVTLLKSQSGALPQEQSVNICNFTSAADLENMIQAELSLGSYDAVVMAAAVADYVPEPCIGKLSSDSEVLRIELRRRGKILPLLRGWIGNDAVVVGFKLLSGVSREELERVAKAQLDSCALDLVVANELSELRGGEHPVLLCKRDGSTEVIAGARKKVALEVAREIWKCTRNIGGY